MLSSSLFLRVFLFLGLETLLRSVNGLPSTGGRRVLVVLEPRLAKDPLEFASFFGGLEERGYNLTFRPPKAESPELTTDDVPNFDHIIFFSPTTKAYAKDLTPQNLLSLISQNVNVLFALGSSNVHTPFTTFASEFGLVWTPPGVGLISHFPERTQRDTLEIDVSDSPLYSPKNSKKGKGSTGSKKILYKGSSHAYSLPTPHNLFQILRAPAESFSVDMDTSNTDKSHGMIVDAFEKGGEGLWAGSGMGVVSGFVSGAGVGRGEDLGVAGGPTGSGRVLFCGSVEMFSEEFVKAKLDGEQTANGDFIRDLTKWVFQETRVVRIANVEHNLAETGEKKETYTINDVLKYTVKLETYDSESSSWKPFAIPKDDVLQLEYTMLDPHVRTNLTAVPNKAGHYTTTFRLPDRHGVFKLSLTHFRKGYTPLRHRITTPLVPPRHDGYPRFLTSGWPYYVGAFSTSAGFVLFCVLWLGGGSSVETEGGKGKKKRE